LNTIFEQLRFLRPGWTDLVEILIVAFLLYRILLVIQRTRAMQIMLGVVLLAFTYGVARLLDLILIRTLLEAAFQYGAIAILVVFQPELRAALARLGQSRMMRPFQHLEGSRVTEERWRLRYRRRCSSPSSHPILPCMTGRCSSPVTASTARAPSCPSRSHPSEIAR
jgi:DNA integrity scanning protein DisA with diadenylate cyclase activity